MARCLNRARALIEPSGYTDASLNAGELGGGAAGGRGEAQAINDLLRLF
jgi:hypothetical protein